MWNYPSWKKKDKQYIAQQSDSTSEEDPNETQLWVTSGKFISHVEFKFDVILQDKSTNLFTTWEQEWQKVFLNKG